MPVTENMILDALRAVRDPERDGDIVSLGMVTGVVIRDGNVGFAIEVEPERGARLEPLRKAAERAVEALPDVMSVTAVLTAEAKPPGGARSAAPAAAPAQAAPAGGKSAIAPGRRARVRVAARRGYRLDAAGHRADRRPQMARHVHVGQCAGARDSREYELFPVPALRRAQRYLLAWRRPPRGGAARCRFLGRGAARSRDPR